MEHDPDTGGEIARILGDWREGDPTAVQRLFPLVYDELRSRARRLLAQAKGHDLSLETAGLVHEAYVKLVDQSRADVHDRSHFFAVASKAMRHILVDRARARCALKRGGGEEPFQVDDAAAVQARATEVLAVDEALTKLEALDRRLVEIVELRFFGGLSVPETAAAMGVSERTVKREWQKARALLLVELSGRSPS